MAFASGKWSALIVSSDPTVVRETSNALSEIGIENSCVSSVDQCRHLMRPDQLDVVFCDVSVGDGNYRDVYRAVTNRLTPKPSVVLMSRQPLEMAEYEKARNCGIFAVLGAPCRASAIDLLTKLLRKNAQKSAKQAGRSFVPKFDIFSGTPGADAIWVCVVEGLANARERMEQIAAENPGRYFVFYSPDRKVLAQTETFPEPLRRGIVQKESV